MLSAAVASSTGEFGPEFDHLTLLVHLEEDWIADVGFGKSSRQPLRMHASLVQAQDGGSYRLERDAGAWIYQEWDGSWKPAYRFTLQPHVLGDFADMCRYQQTSPDRILPETCLLFGKTLWKDHLERSTLDNDNRRRASRAFAHRS